jgi:hypothetical protein
MDAVESAFEISREQQAKDNKTNNTKKSTLIL